MKQLVGIGAVVLALSVFGAGTAAADEFSELQYEISEMQSRLAVLESKQREMRANRIVPATGEMRELIPGVELSGFANVSYTYNLNESNAFGSGTRGFDTEGHAFMLNNIQVNLKKPVDENSRLGFALSLIYGTDAEVVGGVTGGLGAGRGATNGNELEIYEGYVEILADIGNGLDIKVGKFGTLAGAELVPSMDNWNYSRSFIWLLAEPLTHTGIRATYPWSDMIETTFGVNNGWDVVDDNNKAKTLEFGLGVTPNDDMSLYLTYIFGAEQPSDSKDQRHLLTLAAGWDVTEDFSLAVAYDLGWEADGKSEGDAQSKNAMWDGVALYGRYQFTDNWALASRWEWFRDYDDVRVGAGVDDIDLWEFTLTSEWKIYKDMIARLEYRHDKSNHDLFAHDQGVQDYQDTVSAELIYPF